MSTGCPFCDSDCPSVVMTPRYVPHPSVFAFSYVPDNVCHTSLFSDQAYTLSVLQGDSYHDSLHLPFGCDQFLKLGVAKRPSLTAICHYWKYTLVKCFPLQSHWHIFVSHDVVQLTECTPSLSDFPFHFLYLVIVLSYHLPEIYRTYLSTSSIFFPSTITSSFLTCVLHITLVFSRCIKAY